jgi:hypothetical protein
VDFAKFGIEFSVNYLTLNHYLNLITMQESHYLVPHQQQGLEKNLEHGIISDSIEDAEDDFVDAKDRLLDVNNWTKYSEINSIGIRLKDSHGKETSRHARRGDHIRIDMPAGGFNWVVIEAIEYDDYPDQGMETFAIRVRPSENPMMKQADGENTRHETTGTFVIERRGRRLFASYHGRNEPGTRADNVWMGLDDAQWAGLVKGFAEPMLVKR